MSLECCACCLIIALTLGVGCSKKPEPPTKESAVESPAATPTVAESSPLINQKPSGESVKASSTPDQQTEAIAPSTANATATSTVPVTSPRSAAEVAQSYKTTGDRRAAIAAIRQYAVNNPASLGELTELLISSDPDVAMLGAEGLASLGTKEAAAELIGVIQAAQPGNLKRELTAVLASFSNPQAADLFMAMAGSTQDRELASSIQSALGNSASGPVLAEVVQRYQSTTSPEERDNLIAAIRHMQNPDCVDGLIAILNEQKVVSSTEPLGLAAADTLGIIGSTNAVGYLFGYLNNLRPGDSSPVYDAIGRVSNPESLPLLASVAYGQAAGSTLYARMSAVQSLGNYNSSLVAPVLNWLIQNDTNSGIQEAARVALQNSAGR